MTAADFAAWVAAMKTTRGLTQKACADRLGIQPRQIIRWRENGAPAYIALACAAIVAGLAPWANSRPGAIDAPEA